MLGSLLAVLIGVASTNVPPPQPSLTDVYEAIGIMMLPGLEVRVEQFSCGEVNAAYLPRQRVMWICNELLVQASPAVVRAVVAHEMAHAIIRQYSVPFTGSEEVAADELSAVMMANAGHQTDVLQAAALLEQWSLDPTYRDVIEDEHPSLPRRVYTLRCLEDGSEQFPNDLTCQRRFERAAHNWDRLLKLHQIAE